MFSWQKLLIPDADKFALKAQAEATAPTAGMYLKALGATTAHIGDGNLAKKAVTAVPKIPIIPFITKVTCPSILSLTHSVK